MSAIPMQLATGFLGSGKTTFLKNYLEEFSGGRKIGIIQNEFSEVNIDSHELRQGNADWCLVDALNFEKISSLQTRVNHQIRIADTIIVNKTDLTVNENDQKLFENLCAS